MACYCYVDQTNSIITHPCHQQQLHNIIIQIAVASGARKVTFQESTKHNDISRGRIQFQITFAGEHLLRIQILLVLCIFKNVKIQRIATRSFRSHWKVIKMKGPGTDQRVPKPRSQKTDLISYICCTCYGVRSTWVGRNIVPFFIRLRGWDRNQTSLAQIYQWRTASASNMQAVNNNIIKCCCCLFILVNFCDIRMYNNWCMWVNVGEPGRCTLILMYCQTNAFKTFNVGYLQKISNIVICWLIERSIDVNICGLIIG